MIFHILILRVTKRVRFKNKISSYNVMGKNNEISKRAEPALTILNNIKTKKKATIKISKIKGDNILLSNNLLNDKKLKKSTNNKMLSQFMAMPE
jgi:hypothetical protein